MQCYLDTDKFKERILNYDYSVSPTKDIYELYLSYINLLPTALYVTLSDVYKITSCLEFAKLEDVNPNTKVHLTLLKYKERDIYIARFCQNKEFCINQCELPDDPNEAIIVYLTEYSSPKKGTMGIIDSLTVIHEFTHVVKHINGFNPVHIIDDEYATDQIMFYILDNNLNVDLDKLKEELKPELFECDDDYYVYEDRIDVGLKLYNTGHLSVLGF